MIEHLDNRVVMVCLGPTSHCSVYMPTNFLQDSASNVSVCVIILQYVPKQRWQVWRSNGNQWIRSRRHEIQAPLRALSIHSVSVVMWSSQHNQHLLPFTRRLPSIWNLKIC